MADGYDDDNEVDFRISLVGSILATGATVSVDVEHELSTEIILGPVDF